VIALAIPLHDTTAVAQHGLCATCANMPGCGFYRGPNPVIHCEEFTVDETPMLPPSRFPRRSILALRKLADGTILGICVNCDESARCTFRTPDRAIWQCEEYR
jgi:hypothetical protein